MAERLSNLGYLAVGKETGGFGVAVTPTAFVPLYDESLNKNYNFQEQQPAAGVKHATFATLPGQREFNGDLTVLAEPNTTGFFYDALYTKASSSGTNPTTHVLEPTGNSNSYTYDVSTGNVLTRYCGVMISEIGQDWDDNELRHKLKVSALYSVDQRTLATVNTTTITLGTTANATPNRGFVVGDLVRLYKPSTGATSDTTVTGVNADGVTLTLGASAAAFAAGDIIYLRPSTVAFNLLNTFLWANTVIGTGATASAALANATRTNQFRFDQGTEYTHTHNFKDNGGEKRSGSFDPAALVRTTDEQKVSLKKFFDTPDDIQRANDLNVGAVVFRHFAGPNDMYELRTTFYNCTYDTPFSDAKAGDILYSTATLHINQDQTTGKATTVTILNGQATL